MNLDPRSLRAASLWAQAQSAERHKHWQLAYDLYAQVVSIYKDLDDDTRVPKTLHHMCMFAKEHELWPSAAEAARMLMKFYQEHFIEHFPDLWLIIGQAERRCHNVEAARRALIEAMRESGANMAQQSVHFPAWAQQVHDHALALYEWALLESETGMIKDALGMMALSELTVNLFEDAETAVKHEQAQPYAKAQLTALRALRETIVADRMRLQAQLSERCYEP